MSALQNVQTQKSFQYLKEVETIGQDILTEKQNKLELSNAQNKYREALRALESSTDRKTWIKLGNIHIERPTEECKFILKQEIQKAEEDLNNLHSTLKEKLSILRDLEHEPRLEGFALKPISVSEAKALHKGFGLF